MSSAPTLAAFASIRPDDEMSLHPSWLEGPDSIHPGEGFTTGEKLGEGGSCVVTLATQNALGRDVAVKAMRPDRASLVMEQVLLREAWVTGALEHPNIVPVYDITRDSEGRPQIVLKRITGRSWFDLLWREDELAQTAAPMDVVEWNVRTLIQVANAIHFAHERGFLHRDLKPENVMIGDFGEVYVVDWGLALRLDPDGDRRIPLAGDRHRVAGTPAYMAPEMLGEGGRLGRWTDVHLLGATLHHVLTGQPPFAGEVDDALFERIRRGRFEPPEGPFGKVVARATHPDPAQRYPTALAFRLALEQCLQRRGADALFLEAQARLLDLEAAIDAGEHERLYELYGACRAGFRQALTAFPGHEDAATGLARADRAIGRFEARVSALAADEADRDPAKGRHVRTALVAGLGLMWTVSSGTAPLWQDLFTGSSWVRLLRFDFGFIAIVGVLAFLGRKTLMTTRFNRQIVGTVLVTLVMQAIVDIGSLWMGHPEVVAHSYHPAVWAGVLSIVALLLERRVLPSAIGFAASFLVAAANPELLWWAISGGCLIFTVNTLWLWGGPECD